MKSAPKFKLRNQLNQDVFLDDFLGKWVVLYFYPKDNTPGCTREAKDFTCMSDAFARAGAVVMGVSADTVKSHAGFAEKNNLEVTLLSDLTKEVIEKYGVWKLKKRYGKEYYGVIRSTFLINPEGFVVKAWENVRVSGHAEQVLTELQSRLQQ